MIYSYDKPAHKIMDKIAENETDVCMVVVSNEFLKQIHKCNCILYDWKHCFQINNRLMELNQKESALIVHTQDDGKWKRLNNSKYKNITPII